MLCITVHCAHINHCFSLCLRPVFTKNRLSSLHCCPRPCCEHLSMGQARNPQTQRTLLCTIRARMPTACACMHCMCVKAMETGLFPSARMCSKTRASSPRLHIQAHSAERLVQVVTDTSIPPRWRELQLERLLCSIVVRPMFYAPPGSCSSRFRIRNKRMHEREVRRRRVEKRQKTASGQVCYQFWKTYFKQPNYRGNFEIVSPHLLRPGNHFDPHSIRTSGICCVLIPASESSSHTPDRCVHRGYQCACEQTNPDT